MYTSDIIGHMVKPKTTRTFGPLHFEDLEPHRFESLVRNLLYDFRNWSNIEPTGQAGSDDGFDIRAWEKTEEIQNTDEKEAESDTETDSVSGSTLTKSNVWQIQCKREKELGPSKVGKIVSETVKEENSIYGYILAAPVVFSKKTYDIFREKLSKKGVLEFRLWGRSELEDMLLMPKNDRILFSFFGFSLTTQKRSKTMEIKFALNNKNKLYRLLDGQEHNNFHMSVLIRDFNDTNYPYKEKYKDFKGKPRWKECIAYSYHPLGLWVHIGDHFAYIDKSKKEYDFIKSVDLLQRESEMRSYHDLNKDLLREHAEDYWTHLSLTNQAHISIDGLIMFEDMIIIDNYGDVLFSFPHIYIDYEANKGLFKYYRCELRQENEDPVDLYSENYKKVKFFPDKFSPPKFNKIYQDEIAGLNEQTINFITTNYPLVGRIFDVDLKYKYLKEHDVVVINKPKRSYDMDTKDKTYFEITHISSTTISQLPKDTEGHTKEDLIEKQIGRKVKKGKKVEVLELREISEWKIKERNFSNK